MAVKCAALMVSHHPVTSFLTLCSIQVLYIKSDDPLLYLSHHYRVRSALHNGYFCDIFRTDSGKDFGGTFMYSGRRTGVVVICNAL